MNKEMFKLGFPGRLEPTTFTEKRFKGSKIAYEDISGFGFVPNMLPPRDIDYPEIVYKNCEALMEAQNQLSRLDTATRDLENPYLLIGPLVMREAKMSSAIENTYASAEQVALFEDDPSVIESTSRQEVQEVRNYVRALHYGYQSDLPICKRLILEMHNILLNGITRHDAGTPGKFRATQNAIGHRKSSFPQARFVPTPPRFLTECLDDLENYINYKIVNMNGGNENVDNTHEFLPPLIRFAITHYQFECIHPFDDGNGRLGRLVIALQLCKEAGNQQKLVSAPLLYISGYFEENREEYYDRLLAVSTHGKWQEWIEFFLAAIASQAQDANARAKRLLNLRQNYHERVREKRSSAMLPMVIDALFERPSTTIARVTELTKMTPASAGKLVAKLEEKSILIEITGRSKGRIYIAREILDATE